MKAAYTIILASILLFPLTFAAAEKFGQIDCGMEICLPAELSLTPEQRKQLQAIHASSRQKREALRQETRTQILQLLTPEQAQVLKAHNGRLIERQAEHGDAETLRLGMRADGSSER